MKNEMRDEKADAMIPYQFPNPSEARKEIVVGSAIPVDKHEWVPQAKNVWFRPLCLNVSHGYWTSLLRMRKSGVLSRHRHPAPVHGFVLKGRWRYREHGWAAQGGATCSNDLGKRTPCMCRKTLRK